MARVNAEQAKNSFVFTATDGGYGKKTPIDEYRLPGQRWELELRQLRSMRIHADLLLAL